MQGERVVYQNFTLSPPPPKIVFLIQGADRLLRPGGRVFFYRMWCIKTLTPPPTPQKKKIIVTYENCTLPPRQKQF